MQGFQLALCNKSRLHVYEKTTRANVLRVHQQVTGELGRWELLKAKEGHGFATELQPGGDTGQDKVTALAVGSCSPGRAVGKWCVFSTSSLLLILL